MTIGNFTSVYTGYALVVTNDTNCTQFNNGSFLNYDAMSTIKGTTGAEANIYNIFRSFSPLLFGGPVGLTILGGIVVGAAIYYLAIDPYLDSLDRQHNGYYGGTTNGVVLGSGYGYSYSYRYRTRSYPLPVYAPYVPPVHTITYWGPNPDGSWGLITDTTTGNPEEIKNQKILEGYLQKKASELAKIAGIIDEYLEDYIFKKQKKELKKDKEGVTELIKINYAEDIGNSGDPKDPLLVRIRKMIEERKEQTKKGLGELRSGKFKDGLRNVLVGTAGITIPVGLLATCEMLNTYFNSNK